MYLSIEISVITTRMIYWPNHASTSPTQRAAKNNHPKNKQQCASSSDFVSTQIDSVYKYVRHSNHMVTAVATNLFVVKLTTFNPSRTISSWVTLFIYAIYIPADLTTSSVGYAGEEYSNNAWPLGICTIPNEVGLVGLRPCGFLAHKTHQIGECANFQWPGVLVIIPWQLFSWLEMSSISVADVTSQLLGIWTIPYTAYST